MGGVEKLSRGVRIFFFWGCENFSGGGGGVRILYPCIARPPYNHLDIVFIVNFVS